MASEFSIFSIRTPPEMIYMIRKRSKLQKINKPIPRQLYRVYAYYDIDYEPIVYTYSLERAKEYVAEFIDDMRHEGRNADAIIEIQQGGSEYGDWETLKQWTPRDIWNFPRRAWEYG